MARLVLSPLLVATLGAAAPEDGLAPKCATLLGGVATSGHSDTEIAAFCRAAYTPEMCGTLRASLGRMPWPAAKIQATCQQWDTDVKTASADRDLMSYQDFQTALEGSAAAKAQVGYQMPRNGDGSINLDKAVKQKYQQTQNVVGAYNSYMGNDTPPTPKPQSGWGGWGKSGPKTSRLWTAGRGIAAAAVEDVRLTACGMLAVLAVVAGVAVGLKRAMRRAQRSGGPLLEDGQEQEEAPLAE